MDIAGRSIRTSVPGAFAKRRVPKGMGCKSSDLRSEGAAEWPATGLENRGGHCVPGVRFLHLPPHSISVFFIFQWVCSSTSRAAGFYPVEEGASPSEPTNYRINRGEGEADEPPTLEVGDSRCKSCRRDHFPALVSYVVRLPRFHRGKPGASPGRCTISTLRGVVQPQDIGLQDRRSWCKSTCPCPFG